MKKHLAVSILIASMITGSLASCSTATSDESAGNTTSSKPANTDPQKGWVSVFSGNDTQYDPTIYKRCDGPNLVYATETVWAGDGGAGGGVSVVPNSTECAN